MIIFEWFYTWYTTPQGEMTQEIEVLGTVSILIMFAVLFSLMGIFKILYDYFKDKK